MSDGSPARFRIRIGGAEERTVASIEALSRLVESGEVGPDTPLHDAGTGQWGPAADIPVVCFVVEELRREGRAPSGWGALPEGGTLGAEAASEGPAPGSPAPGSPAPPEGFEGEESAGLGVPEEGEHEPTLELEDLESLPLTPDPFEMHLPLRREEREDSQRDVDEEVAGSPEGAGDDAPGVGGEGAGPGFGPEHVDSGATAPPPRRASLSTPPGEDPWAAVDEWDDWLPPEEGAEPQATRPSPEPARARLSRGRRMAALLGGVVVLVLVLALFARPGQEGEAGPDGVVPAGDAPQVEALPAGPPPPPADLEPAVTAVAALMPGLLDHLVDSLRVEAGVPAAPPREWLTGYYLSHASLFDPVPDFWDAYGRFALELRGRDRALFGQALERALDDVGEEAVPDGSRAAVRAYVAARYPYLREAREERYLQLAGAADAAVELHRFLVVHEDRIAHAPALGRGVSADPILEAVPANPEIQREMEGRLDRVFEALDRSRRGGPPSLEGLRVELFQRFGDPV